MDIRSGSLDDLDQLVALNAAVRPESVSSRAGHLRGLTAATGETGTAYAAERDGQLIGWASVRPAGWLTGDDAYALHVMVHPDYRRQGIGSELLRRCEAWLATLPSWFVQSFANEAGTEFAARAGFTVAGELTYAGLDLDDLPPAAPVPADLALVPFTQLTPADVFPAYRATTTDIPGGTAVDPDFDWFEQDVWSEPSFDHDLSLAFVADGEVVAFTIALREENRLWSDMTGTVATHRRRGLARVLKSASLAAARQAGVTAAYTIMNLENEPMLAVNRHLGYRAVGLRTQVTKEHGR
ncbi:GNAT family N-acetyltransferase [Kribbella sp. NPDC056951]|uniref:GNAT family N-acetyltransferase n=1 Tax=Kribbella sp. NPDC056951 TaxID=3345978 RepID=UPI003628E6BD